MRKSFYKKIYFTASIMSAPRLSSLQKILIQKDKENINRELDISKEKIGSNVLDAISRGQMD
jgi:CNT family concentrative nucleoside transporter